MTTRRTPTRTIANAATTIAQDPRGDIVSTTKILIFVPSNVAQGCKELKVMDRVFLVYQGSFHPTNFQIQIVKNVSQVNMHWRSEVKHAKTVAEVNTKIEMDRAVATTSILGIAAPSKMVLITNRNAQQGEQAVVAVNFVVTVQMEHTTTLRVKQVASTVQVVLVKKIKDKCRVLSAVPVNSTMLLVLLSVNRVIKTRITVKREETPVAPIVRRVGFRKRAVLNVPCVAQVRLVLSVKIACRVNIVRVRIKMRRLVLIVSLVLAKVI